MLLTQKCKFVKIKYIEVKLNQKYIRRERNIMMKKNGFTLAEVLITLAIIGVVATMTLPALMTNTAEQQAKTGLKKGINTLTEAAQMNQAIDGFDYASLTSTDTESTDEQSLYALLSKRASVDYGKSGLGKHFSIQSGAEEGKDNYAVFFRDGAAVLFSPDASVMSANNVSTMESDGMVHGIGIIYDTNGSKGPNILSNCAGNAQGEVDVQTNECTSTTRVIKDQFGVRLRAGYAVPNGPAARWAFEN